VPLASANAANPIALLPYVLSFIFQVLFSRWNEKYDEKIHTFTYISAGLYSTQSKWMRPFWGRGSTVPEMLRNSALVHMALQPTRPISASFVGVRTSNVTKQIWFITKTLVRYKSITTIFQLQMLV
jgi:hypothetical protein